MYGNFPDDQLEQLQVGKTIPLTSVKPVEFQVGTRGIPKDVEIGQFRIIEIHEKRTEIDVPYIELFLTRIL
jgi:hypothetical protein